MKNLMTMTGIRPDNAKSQQWTKQKKQQEGERVETLPTWLPCPKRQSHEMLVAHLTIELIWWLLFEVVRYCKGEKKENR